MAIFREVGVQSTDSYHLQGLVTIYCVYRAGGRGNTSGLVDSDSASSENNRGGQ